MPGGLYGLRGLSGASGVFFHRQPDIDPLPHFDELVKVVDDHPSLDGKTFNLVTPFAGKDFCFKDYVNGIRRLPLEKAHAVLYDNSNDRLFREKLNSLARNEFDSYTIIEDRNENKTVENTEEYGLICHRCYKIYDTIMANHIKSALPLTMIVEDDVEIPEDTWRRLNYVLEDNPKIATVVGSCSSRRMNDATATVPIAFNFERTEQVGGGGGVKVSDKRLLNSKEYGVELIGSAHMACWLSRTDVIKEIGMRHREDNIPGVDLNWGYVLNLSGYLMAIDWSVKTKHYYVSGGKKEYVAA